MLSVYPAPTITVQPLPRSVNEGQSATFTVTATGSGLAYQWYRGTNIIPGATSRTLTLSDVGIGDVGTYSVTVANGTGNKTSNSVALTIKLKPVVNALNLPDAVVSQLYSYPCYRREWCHQFLQQRIATRPDSGQNERCHFRSPHRQW